MWSDPDEVDAWAVSPRGAGWLFGAKVTAEVHYSSLTSLRLAELASLAVQPRQLPHNDRPSTPISPRRLQIHVQRIPRHRVVRTQLLLSMWE